MKIKYIELKTGYNDDGPAWIGNVKESKSLNESHFDIQDIDDVFPIERIPAILNEQNE